MARGNRQIEGFDKQQSEQQANAERVRAEQETNPKLSLDDRDNKTTANEILKSFPRAFTNQQIGSPATEAPSKFSKQFVDKSGNPDELVGPFRLPKSVFSPPPKSSLALTDTTAGLANTENADFQSNHTNTSAKGVPSKENNNGSEDGTIAPEADFKYWIDNKKYIYHFAKGETSAVFHNPHNNKSYLLTRKYHIPSRDDDGISMSARTQASRPSKWRTTAREIDDSTARGLQLVMGATMVTGGIAEIIATWGWGSLIGLATAAKGIDEIQAAIRGKETAVYQVARSAGLAAR